MVGISPSSLSRFRSFCRGFQLVPLMVKGTFALNLWVRTAWQCRALLTRTGACAVALSSPGQAKERQVVHMSAAPATKARAKAAIVGAFAADAATMPLHWIYDTEKIRELLTSKGQIEEPEFFAEPACPFYTYELGALSPYGDEIQPLLRHVARNANFDAAAFAEESYSYLKSYKGRLNHVSKQFVELKDQSGVEASVDDSQAHGIIKVPILVARYAGKPELLGKVEEAVRVHQSNDVSVAASVALAKVLEMVVLGSTVKDAVEWAQRAGGLAPRERAYLEQAMAKTYPDSSAIKDFGWSCALPGALLGSIYTAYHAPDYVAAVRASMLAGGDSCSRNIVIGALMAAQSGDADTAVPEEWRTKMKAYSEINELADQVVSRL